MKCPACRSAKSSVLETEHDGEGIAIRRRRECHDCDERWTTYEVMVRPANLRVHGFVERLAELINRTNNSQSASGGKAA